jgi:hypothetical protein
LKPGGKTGTFTALVRSERSDVGEIALQASLHEAEHVRRCFDHRGPVVSQGEMTDAVNRLGVCGQQHRAGIHQVFPEHDLRRLRRAEGAQPFAQGDLADRHQLREVDLGRAVERLQLAQPLLRVAGGISVLNSKPKAFERLRSTNHGVDQGA